MQRIKSRGLLRMVSLVCLGRYGPVSFGLVPHFLAAMPGSLVLFVLCLFGQAVGVVTALPGGGVSI